MENRAEGSSSDDMIDIQIEDSLVRESLMTIDSTNFKEAIFAIMGFAGVLLLLIIMGISGPAATYTTTSELHEIAGRSKRLELNILNVSQMNRFVEVAMVLKRNSTSFNTSGVVRITYEALFVNSKQEYVHPIAIMNHVSQVIFESGATDSKPITIWRENIIDFENMSISVKVDRCPDGITSTYAQIKIGDMGHTAFQIYFREAASVVTIICLVLLLRSLCTGTMKLWHLEQKLTVPLLVLLILYDNPLYVFHVNSPSKTHVIMNTVLSATFLSYFRFFILVLFASLRFKNRKTDRCFFQPKVVFVAILFLASIVHGIYDDIASFDVEILETDELEARIRWTEITLYLVYIVWTGIAIIHAGLHVDVTEKYKFMVYLSGGCTALVMLLVVHVLFGWYGWFRESSLSFIMSFAVENVFVLMMVYFHWPFERIADKPLDKEDPEANNQIQAAEFNDQNPLESIKDDE